MLLFSRWDCKFGRRTERDGVTGRERARGTWGFDEREGEGICGNRGATDCRQPRN